MTLQRCFLQLSRQYVSRSCLLQSNLKQTYCVLRHHYSSGDPSRKYTQRHEWIVVNVVNNDNVGTVGISKYAQESLGDIVFAQLPEPETLVDEGEECGALESVKAASEIYSPVTGIIIEKNKLVESKPSLINNDYYYEGWLFKLKLTKPEELKNLMDEEKYNTFLKTDVENVEA